MPRTGDPCATPGAYESDCEHALARRFHADERFPDCSRCGGAVNWLLADFTERGQQRSGERCPERRER